MPGDMPALIRFLKDDLKFRIRRRTTIDDLSVYLVDLSEWKLRLSDRTPFICVDAGHLASLPTEELVAVLRTLVRTQHFGWRVPFVVVEGTSPELREAVHLQIPYSVVLDEEDLQRIAARPLSDRRILEEICQQLPLASLSPYEISSPVTGSRFFGREYELRTILHHPDTDYVIVGVRRIGKSSLLLELKRRMEEFEDGGDGTVFFFDCSDFHSKEDYIRAVVTELDIRERQRMTFQKFPNFLQYKSYRGKRPLTFLLDEIDYLIHFDRQDGWSLLRTLRASSQKGFCRYILTGYREAIEESLSDQSPLYNFVTRLPLGNLSRDDTRKLVTAPMQSLGVTLEREKDLTSQIFEQTAGHPNYVQFYCYSLVQLMDREDRRHVSPNDLVSVQGDEEFERYVFRTFSSNSTDLEKAVVYCMLMDHEDQFTTRDVDIGLKKRKVFVTAGQIEQACDNLRTAGVLDKQGRTFAFAIPILIQLLQDHYDVEYLFVKAREDGRLG